MSNDKEHTLYHDFTLEDLDDDNDYMLIEEETEEAHTGYNPASPTWGGNGGRFCSGERIA